MTRTLTSIAAMLLAAAAGCGAASSQETPPETPPKPTLIVQLVVDQFRADYVSRYRGQWSRGLDRLLTRGATFPEAAYPYGGTSTCAGHASIGTGALPSAHGMVLNAWWDAEAGRRRACTEDGGVEAIGFTADSDGRHSARWLRMPTFAERLDESQPEADGRVVALSLKARSAIGLAGHGGDAVVWFERPTFATSSAYGRPRWLEKYLKAHPIDEAVDAAWTRALPPARYAGDDDEPGAMPPAGWSTEFPHPLSEGKADRTFYDRWQRSPYSDAYLGEMAIAAVDAMQLGRGAGIDYLGIGFSALDLVGHKFGPDSHEVQDVLIGLDAVIGRLLDHLDDTVGSDNYVVALTADHGVGPPPGAGKGAGRFTSDEIHDAVDDVLDRAWGRGDHVADVVGVEVYLHDPARLRRDDAAEAELRARFAKEPAVAGVMMAGDFALVRESDDRDLRTLAASHYPGRSGDLLVVLRENFTSSTDAASHGTHHAYDRRVPVILFGNAFKTGTYDGPASPLDIAPTWARLIGITLDGATGRSLDRAIR